MLPSLIYYKTPKKLLKRFTSFIVPIIIFVIYLLVTGAMNDFIDLCFLGLFDFLQKNGSLNICIILTFIVLLIIISMIKKDPKNICNYYALAFLSIIIPIFDLYHFFIGINIFILVVLLNYNIKIPINLKLFVFGIITIISILYIQDRFKNKIIYPNNVNNFEYRLLGYDEIKFTDKYINFINKNKDKKIINLTSNAYYFKIITNQDINKLDLINEGNWGYNGSEKLLKEIKNNKDAIFIIDEQSINIKYNQLNKKVLKYIISNGKKIGTINYHNIKFSVYILNSRR